VDSLLPFGATDDEGVDASDAPSAAAAAVAATIAAAAAAADATAAVAAAARAEASSVLCLESVAAFNGVKTSLQVATKT
jgi:hypothetical protein